MDLVAGSLALHHQVQHETDWRPQWENNPLPPHPSIYRASFTKAARLVGFLVEDCGGWVTTRTNLRINLVHRHMRETIVIMEGGNCYHYRCSSYNMFVPWEEINHHHPTTALCAWDAEWK